MIEHRVQHEVERVRDLLPHSDLSRPGRAPLSADEIATSWVSLACDSLIARRRTGFSVLACAIRKLHDLAQH